MVDTDSFGAGYFSGKSHSFVAQVTSPAAAPLYTIEGQWTGSASFTVVNPAAAHAVKAKVGAEFANFENVKRHPIEVKPVEEMGEYESRKVWKDVSAGIRSGAFDVAQAAKAKIEVRSFALICSDLLLTLFHLHRPLNDRNGKMNSLLGRPSRRGCSRLSPTTLSITSSLPNVTTRLVVPCRRG